jgi:toxin-antitoxin system PIN domain toxin
MRRLKYLLDVNVLIALTDLKHIHHRTAMQWFNTPGIDWGICAFSEAGFLCVAMNPRLGADSLDEAIAVLAALPRRPGYRYWPIKDDCPTLVGPFARTVFGPQQITDAYLLGLAVREEGVLVTFDKAIRHMAGARHSKNVLVLG